MKGVKRAGKYGDAYATPLETAKDEVLERFRLVRDLFAERGKEFNPQPVRRNVLVGDTREEAMQEYARVAQCRYLICTSKGLDVMKGTDLENKSAGDVPDHAVVGDAEQVAAQLTDLVTTLPVDPCSWPQ